MYSRPLVPRQTWRLTGRNCEYAGSACVRMRREAGVWARRSPGHDEQLSHHPGALADKLLHQLRAGDADKGAVRVVRHGTRQQRLPCAGDDKLASEQHPT